MKIFPILACIAIVITWIVAMIFGTRFMALPWGTRTIIALSIAIVVATLIVLGHVTIPATR